MSTVLPAPGHNFLLFRRLLADMPNAEIDRHYRLTNVCRS